MLNSNLASFLFGPGRRGEFRETHRAWKRTEALWRRSPLARRDLDEIAGEIVQGALRDAERPPAPAIIEALTQATTELLVWEDIGPLEVDWDAIAADPLKAIRLRQMLARRRRWAADFAGTLTEFSRVLRGVFSVVIGALPEICVGQAPEGAALFELTLVELLERPAHVIESHMFAAYGSGSLNRELFCRARQVLERNLMAASGLSPESDIRPHLRNLTLPTRQKLKSTAELVELYLVGTPFADVLQILVPFHLPEHARFEHCHIVGGTGHGKTQLMQRMIHADLVKARHERRSVVVIDSQGDLINKLVRLDLFDPGAQGSLADRLVLIDPADVEFPAALNLFDAHLDRVREYRPIDRERVLNGVIELYEVFFGAMLGAELTQKQGVIFRYLARLMVTIPGATIHTLMQIMEDGRPFRRHMAELDGSARYFYQTEFFHPSFAATKKQILKRLWGVLSTPAFERMFAQERNKLDLFEALNDGKIVLVSTAKDLLKADGSALFGRFFIAMLAQAALERSTLDEDERTPTFVYVDEAQEYFDDSVETVLNQARKYMVGFTLAHQNLDQLSPRLRAAFHTNTSFKCVGGVSAKDARALADEMHTSSNFIEGMRRRGGRSEFAVWLKHQTPQAIRITVPLGYLERQPLLSEEAYAAVIEANRERYCGTLADVVGFEVSVPSERETDAPPRRAQGERPAMPIDEPEVEPPETIAEANVSAEPPPPDRLRQEPRARPRGPVEPRELGKGGSQHRYVQHLIKGLAEERGFRTVIEDAVDGGQVDVALHRDGLSIACEISVTSKAEYEAQNLAKCVRAGFPRIWAIASDQRQRRLVEAAAKARLGADDLAKVEFLLTGDVIMALDGLVARPTEETRVRGYKVKVSHKAVSASESQDRRAAIARVVSQSLRGLDPER